MILIANGGVLNEANTMEAIMLINNCLYIDGIMLDVRKTVDDVFVLESFDELNKNTLSNKIISQSLYKDIKNTKFPSHIFKYYIPKLEEALKNINYNKIIILKIHNIDNKSLYKLFNIINKYNYKYYFITSDELIKKEIINNKYHICDNFIYLDEIDKELEIDNETFIISKNPIRIYKYYNNRQNN